MEIKALIPNAHCVKVAMNYVVDCYAGIDVRGCFCKFSQRKYRKVQALGFQERYQDDSECVMSVRMIAAVAFVSLSYTLQVFENLQELEEGNYIGRRSRRSRASTVFVPQVWSGHCPVNNQLPCTNNSVEGWHRKMQAAVAADHPQIWRIFDNASWLRFIS
ncbi:hypothetical protein ACJMK2_030954 [Sinanodonta woodiana]|uniref:Transposase n=1 Tax=Sinanodonta woodiana TaxID=1069815 RepID=A0ABD3X1A0_SINWO